MLLEKWRQPGAMTVRQDLYCEWCGVHAYEIHRKEQCHYTAFQGLEIPYREEITVETSPPVIRVSHRMHKDYRSDLALPTLKLFLQSYGYHLVEYQPDLDLETWVRGRWLWALHRAGTALYWFHLHSQVVEQQEKVRKHPPR